VIPIHDTIPSRGVPVVTWSLIALNVLVFLYELTLDPIGLDALMYLFGIVPVRYTQPDWAHRMGLPLNDYWPFLTSMFLHGGLWHLVSNMWALWIFGDNVEERMGRVPFLLFYLSSGLAAGVIHWITNAHSTMPTIGASGAIAGVLGAYFLLFPHARIIAMIPIFFWPFFFEVPAVTYLFVWYISQLFSGTLEALGPQSVGGVAWWAHVGGFVFGMALHRLFLLPERRRGRARAPDEFVLEEAWSR
jgi:membrane associated rhomboid family serine protease